MRILLGAVIGAACMILAQLFIGRFLAGETTAASLALAGIRHQDPLAAFADDANCDESLATIRDVLGEMQQGQRIGAYEQWHERFEDQCRDIERIAADPKSSPDTRYCAFLILGNLGRSAAIPLLVENLEWEYSGMLFVDEAIPYDEHPCYRALSEIGISCVPELVSSLARMPAESVTKKSIDLRVALIRASYRPYSVAKGGNDEAVAAVRGIIKRMRGPALGGGNIEPLLSALSAP